MNHEQCAVRHGNKTKPSKMASIAGDMLAAINSVQRKNLITALHKGSGLSEKVFPKTSLSQRFSLDTTRWIDGSYMNPNAMFDMFGEYSRNSGMVVRKRMLKYMGINKRDGANKSDILLRYGYVSLAMQGITAQEWADNMQLRDTPGDEIALHTLCKMYDRHCCVYTSANLWTTIENKHHGFTEEEMLEKCDIKLLYIEPGVFGVLHSKPAMPPPPTFPYCSI